MPALIAPHLRRYLAERSDLGRQRYGIALHAHNGRDALRDAFEEAVDLVQYLAQALLERDGRLPDGSGVEQPLPATMVGRGVEQPGSS